MEYGGGGQRGFIATSEDRERRCWRSCAAKLQKVAAFLKLLFDEGSRMLPS
jgi:hypothetical protein